MYDSKAISQQDDTFKVTLDMLKLTGSICWRFPSDTSRLIDIYHRMKNDNIHSTLTKKSLATLQPVEQPGTSIFWNGHNIANTACIHFEFGTVNNRYMPNSEPMKLGKI